MLQTMPIKPDAAAQTLAKDKATATENRSDNANTFYSQFLAAMPEARGPGLKADPAMTLVRDPKDTQAFRDPVPSGRMKPQAPQRPIDRGKDPRMTQAAQAVPPRPPIAKAPEADAATRSGQEPDGDVEDNPDDVNAIHRAALARAVKLPDPLGLAAAAPATPSPSDLVPPPDPDGSAQEALTPQDAQAAQAAQAAAATAAEVAATAGAAATAAWLTTPGLQAQDGSQSGLAGATHATQDPTGVQPKAAPGQNAGQAPAQAGPVRPATPETVAAAKAQAALDQLVPGSGKVQFQFGDQPTQTTKPALSEFMNQLKPQLQAPPFAGVGSGSGDPQLPATPLGPQADLQALAPAAPAAVLTAGQLPKEAAPEPLRAPGNISPAETLAVGAAAGPGASTRITAPKAVEHTAPRQENPMTQVDSTIKWLIKNKEQSAELQLHPEHLGRVQVKLTVEGTEVHAKLWASEAAALPVLQEHRAFLEDSLKGQGLHLGSFDLQHGQQGEQAALPRPEPSLPPPLSVRTPEPGQETPAPQPQGAAGPGRISIVA